MSIIRPVHTRLEIVGPVILIVADGFALDDGGAVHGSMAALGIAIPKTTTYVAHLFRWRKPGQAGLTHGKMLPKGGAVRPS